jgi:hypothetical protein
MLVGIDHRGRCHPQILKGWHIGGDWLIYTFLTRYVPPGIDAMPVIAMRGVRIVPSQRQPQSLSGIIPCPGLGGGA